MKQMFFFLVWNKVKQNAHKKQLLIQKKKRNKEKNFNKTKQRTNSNELSAVFGSFKLQFYKWNKKKHIVTHRLRIVSARFFKRFSVHPRINHI